MQFVGLRDDVGPPNDAPRVEPHPEDGHDQSQWVEVLLVGAHGVWNRAVLEESEREEDDVEDALEDVVGEAETGLLRVDGPHDQLVDL